MEQRAGPEISAPLNELAQRVIPYAKALVLEYGIRLMKVGPDRWEYLAKGSTPTTSLSELTGRLGLKAVKVTIGGATYDHDFLLPTAGNRPVLEMQIQDLSDSVGRVDIAVRQHIMNLAYIAEATTYHCNQLVERYLDALDIVTRDRKSLSEDFISSGPVAHYFEFEALVTAVVRAYDTARFPLWRAYGTGGYTPNSFERVVKCLPPLGSMAALCERAVITYQEAKRYRDCIQHYAHFGARLPFARIQLRQGLVWSVLALLPDNPEVKSYEKFKYDGQIDALSCGWRLTNRLLEDLEAVVAALPRGSWVGDSSPALRGCRLLEAQGGEGNALFIRDWERRGRSAVFFSATSVSPLTGPDAKTRRRRQVRTARSAMRDQPGT